MDPASRTRLNRLDARFAQLKAEGRKALIIYSMAGDPEPELSQAFLNGLPAAGADIVELGVPFTDPMADGPTIQQAAQRVLKNGQTLTKTLAQVKAFRRENPDTPLVLMGYYNPIYAYGNTRFLEDAVEAGVDGLIVVDLPREEDAELCLPARAKGLHFIRLLTPTSDAERLPELLTHSSGFLYYVSITGITGSGIANREAVAQHLSEIRPLSDLPIAIGFGIKTPDDVASMAGIADAAVVGSAVVERISQARDLDGVHAALRFVSSLSSPLQFAS